MTDDTSPNPSGSLLSSGRNVAILVYALQAAAFVFFFFPVSYLIAVIVNYVKREDVAGTWVESHFRWQIRTFWWSLLWAALGVLTYVVVIGYLVLVADVIWVIYRIVKGWLRLNENKPMYVVPPTRQTISSA